MNYRENEQTKDWWVVIIDTKRMDSDRRHSAVAVIANSARSAEKKAKKFIKQNLGFGGDYDYSASAFTIYPEDIQGELYWMYQKIDQVKDEVALMPVDIKRRIMYTIF